MHGNNSASRLGAAAWFARFASAGAWLQDRVSASIGTVRYFTGFLSMRKPSSNKRSKTRVRRPTTKTLAVPNDPVKRGPRQPSPQTDSSLVGALFNSQVAVAQLMYQLSPLQMITRQQAIMLDTFASAFNGALEAHDNAE